ncbi:MAG: DUF2460 domain-containing protein [Pseudomonadota bacterium]
MTLHDVRFPAAISFGSSGGIERRTEIVELVNGFEERNSPWAQSRRRWDAGLGIRSLDDLSTVLAFFESRHGRLFAFRWKDWLDHKSCAPSAEPSPEDQSVGTGDGVRVAFPLLKHYADSAGSYVREIALPIAGSVRLAVDGAEQTEGQDFTTDPITGQIVFMTAPGEGAAITAGFAFDVPVRFDSDTIEVNLAAFEAGEIPSVPVIEVRV